MKKHKKGTRAKYSTLVSAVLIGLMSITPYASADESEYLATEYIDYNGRNIAELIFLKESQGIGNNGQWMVPKAVYDLPDALITGAATSATYWTDMLGPTAKNKEPWQIFVTTYWQRNASSSSLSVKSDGVQPIRKSYKNAEHYVSQQLQNGTDYDELTYDKAKTGVLPEGSYAYSRLRIGYYSGAKRTGAEYGWWVDTDTVLPTNEQAVNFAGTVRHELGHALGIVAKRRIRGDNTYFTPGVTDEKSWNLQLYDQNGNKAQSGMQILTSYEFEELKKDKPSISPKDYFIVDKKITDEGEGFAYFSGKNVVDALDGATFFGRSALPVNGWEGDRFEGSHIQTSGMMSHRTYSNYSAFLEVELAALQDLGYDIDRKAYFGRSIYGNKGTIVNNQGFFARNQTGTAYLNNTYSDVNLGIGLHVYGYGNTVTQAADIMTKGNGGTGIRVDGMENTLIIPKDTEIHADGYRGNGVMISYGRNQTVEQAGTVTANGDGGVGMRFDFGSARGGAGSEYRGSYIRYKRWVNSRASGREPGAINSAQNYALTYNMNANTRNVAEDELVGPLVDNYNLSGKLAGSDAAIYISKNALVKNINVNDGASIQGDIVSEWKRFDRESCEEAYDSDGKSRDVLRIQYNNNIGKDGYEYYLYIPDLVTNLNFNNEEMKYTGNISGEENIKMNVNEGTLTYTGEANVINVQVAKDATLLGGSYQVNDLSQKLDKDFTDDTTGKFYNHGTIGAESQNSDMLIKGKLISDGVLAGYAGGDKGQIVVSGTADVEGSMISIDNALPGDEMTVLKADSITGTIGNGDESYAASGMLSTTGTVSGNEIKVQTVASNNLGDIDSTQQAAYNAMTDMYKQLSDTGDDRIDEMRTLYGLDTDKAKEALSSLSANAAAKTMA
ncbi:autotransporter outer membrane beta-barrel domain-containing protein, partial [uncultured Anaerovibrio sp.]|uniref:autotransporter outer membrane beta-barrel domain-containing protein n=1 Tax=uncultured Anaerovibrio sp. TaxID=361586 RepID=UPI0025CBC273